MAAERIRRVRELFERLVELDDDSRARELERACAGAPELRAELLELLAADRAADSFMADPAIASIPDAATVIPLPIQRVGPYRVLRRIGSGGMSDVFLAVRDDDEFDRSVAIKLVRWAPGSDELLARFRAERQILAGLDHPNIATLLDGGTTDDGLPYFVMEHIDGVPIDEYCDRERLDVRRRIELFRQVCGAVQFAHRNLVVHRDIKASNILVGADGVPKLLDFGIATLLDEESGEGTGDLTRTSVRPMTVRWASPEQVLGRPVTTSTDVYSLGVLLYRLLTGRMPYAAGGTTPSELARLVTDVEPERPSLAIDREVAPDDTAVAPTPASIAAARGASAAQLARRLAGDLDRIVLMALRKDPERRYASVEQLAEDLRRSLAGLPVIARPDTWRYRSATFVRRNRLAVAAAGGFVLVLAAFAVTMTVQARSIATQRDEARRERDRAERVQTLLQGLFEAADPLVAAGAEPTARELLDRGAETVERELAGEPLTRASLMHTIGVSYRNVGAYDRARTMLDGALRLRSAELGESAAATARTRAELGELEQLAGRLDRALELQLAAVRDRRATAEPDAELVDMLNDLGATLRQLGRTDEAEARYREALELRATLGEIPELATTLNNLGTLMLQTGRRPDAEALFREVLEIRRRTLGDDHPYVAQSLSNLGATLGMQGRYDEAEPYLREALETYRRVLDADHPAVLEGMNNLAKLRHRTGDLAGAEALYLGAIDSQRERLGDAHPKLGHVWSNLADVAEDAGDLAEAARRHRRAMSMLERALPPEHPAVVRSRAGLERVQAAAADRSK